MVYRLTGRLAALHSRVYCTPLSGVLQQAFKPGHMRRDSQDFAAEWRERTLTDAKRSLHNELEKLIKTASPGHQAVSGGGGVQAPDTRR